MNLRKEKGISLVALVITIIVLIILAGVAISTLSGENNIVSKANLAKDKHDSATKQEQNIVSSMEDDVNEVSQGKSTKIPTGGSNDTIIGTWTMREGEYTDTFIFYENGTLKRIEEETEENSGTWEAVNNQYYIIAVNYDGESDDSFEMGFNSNAKLVYYENGSPDDGSPEYTRQ